MTLEEFRQALIDDLDLESAFFVGNFGGAMLQKEMIEAMSEEELIAYARKLGYTVTEEGEDENPFQKGRH
ncbi:MAG: hypothetical protein J6X28_03355 [Bacilli bacterium]|nr:hypothetical protein [Bacilli bacterium]